MDVYFLYYFSRTGRTLYMTRSPGPPGAPRLPRDPAAFTAAILTPAHQITVDAFTAGAITAT